MLNILLTTLWFLEGEANEITLHYAEKIRAFADLYDSFVGDSFRVVNNLDVVARMPRATMGGISLDYQHSGRTVMVRRVAIKKEGESL